jgi:predicted nucleic acid-binding protein
MTAYLVDSNVLIDALRGRSGSVSLMRELGGTGSVACSVVTTAELLAGMRRNEAKATEDLLSGVRQYEVTVEIANLAGRLRNEGLAAGRSPSLLDMFIAATALIHGMVLVTYNRRHFPMPELKLYPIPEP